MQEVKHGKLAAVEFWEMWGRDAPLVQAVAIRACACVSGASAAERGHKDMGFVLTKSRNRMSHQRMEQLLYCRYNYSLETTRLRGSMSLPKSQPDQALEDADAESDEERIPPMEAAWLDARGAIHEEDSADAHGNAAAIARARRRAEVAAKGRARVPIQAKAIEKGRATAREEAATEAQGYDGQLTGKKATITKIGKTSKEMKTRHKITILKEKEPGIYNVLFQDSDTVAFVNLKEKNCELIDEDEDEEEEK
jgi:hypothetical protein